MAKGMEAFPCVLDPVQTTPHVSAFISHEFLWKIRSLRWAHRGIQCAKPFPMFMLEPCILPGSRVESPLRAEPSDADEGQPAGRTANRRSLGTRFRAGGFSPISTDGGQTLPPPQFLLNGYGA